MKKTVPFILILCMFTFAHGQQWNPKAPLSSAEKRTFAGSFAIGGSVYVIGGNRNYTALGDVWRYDTITDNWTKMNNFPDGVREGAVCFSIGNKGYLVGGFSYQFKSDVWEYDPGADSWTQKGQFPGGPRKEAAGFVIGNKAYVGTGYIEVTGQQQTVGSTLQDFWEYTPATDTWVQKTNVPGVTRGWAIGASLNGKGYIGLGGNADNTLCFADFHEYDPVMNTWTTKAAGMLLGDAMAFSYNNYLYMLGGLNFANYAGNTVVRKYDPVTDTWVSDSQFPGGHSYGGIATKIGARVYVGTGYNENLLEKSDWWSFGVKTPSINTSAGDFHQIDKISVYPNPSDGEIYIKGDGSDKMDIRIFTPDGKPVSYKIASAGRGFSLVMDQASAGIYFIQLDLDGVRVTKKISVR